MTFVGREGEVEAAPIRSTTSTSRRTTGEIDLGAELREMLILAVPMSPRCRDNCLGLCPTCGQNKNERDCGHTAPALEDARFKALKNLKLD